MTKRIKVIQGGTSAGKTYGAIPVLIDRAIKTPRLKITIVAETIPAVKDGSVDIFKEIMQGTGRWREKGWIGNPMEYTFSNKSRIQFKAFDTVGKAKASGKRDILFLNEGNHIAYPIADALMIRSKETYIDFNPDNEFWVHTEVLTESNSEFLLLTYKDNEALPKETLEDLMIKQEKAKISKYWANWCKVYIDGEVGQLEGTIFNNWKQIDSIPKEAEFLGYGKDFGFTNDPTTLIALYKWNSKLIWDELIYEKGLTNPQIARRLKDLGVNPKDDIVADSSEPKSIKEIKSYGFAIKGAEKGKDSIVFGISLLQEYEMLVTARSINVITEFRKYAWDKDREGNTLNKPIDNYNHCIDAMRYIAVDKLAKGKKKKKTKYYA
ncbi:MAG: terminase large subunit [Flavobacteriales bacterium]|nr:terminase large subunit [Flavobacteriales bacterium]